MTRKLGEGDTTRPPPVDGAGTAPAWRAQKPGITCSWCGHLIEPNSRRMRLFQSESIRVSGQWLAHFHIKCGDAILDLCEERQLADGCPEIAAPVASAAASVRKRRPVHAVRDDETSPKAKPDAKALMQEARDLSARGYTQNMIAARLRLPYAVVAMALSELKGGKREPLNRGRP